ncbi:MMPL family transporter [Nocardioides sp.]|uniref:MMPL family transporter n=1 Tax=Nocardioides sp. TaxID=35761 RepID=UPI0037852186
MHRQIAGTLTGRRTKWVVLAIGVIVLLTCAPYFNKLADVEVNDAGSWLPGSAESTRALHELDAFQDPDDIPTVVAYEKDSGLTPADLAALQRQADEFSGVDGVSGPVVGPIPSADGTAAQTLVTFNFGNNGWNSLPGAADDLRAIATLDGGQVYVTGRGGQAADQAAVFSGSDVRLLLATLGIVILILLFTYRSPILWLLPIFSSLVALAASNALVYQLAKHAGLTVNGQSAFILTVLVIGAGTDYALLLVARYREELRNHEDRHEAMGFALHRASPAIIASASTVAVGMLCLTLAEMNSTAGLGPVLAVGVVVTLVVMLTVLPALLVVCGRWVFWPSRPAFGSAEPTHAGVWSRVGSSISRHPRRVWVVTALVLATVSLGLLRLDASGLTTDDTFTHEVESVTGQHVLSEHQLTDTSSPVMVVAKADRADAVVEALQGVDGLGPPSRPVEKDGVVLVTAPLDAEASSPAAFDTVAEVRTAVHAVPGAGALVGGPSAIYADIQRASHRDDLVIAPLVLLVVLLILMLLLRALLSPVLLIATVVLSYGAALGISTLIFTEVYGYPTTDSAFPLFAFVFLVALGIDYNIFLMTRVREETPARGTRQGSLVALSTTGGVITSAGLVLAATFAMLGTLPLVFAREIGTAVAIGVLLDTLVVRSVLVTAINLDLGGRIWWPSALDRRPPVHPSEPAGDGREVPASL